MSLSEPFIKKDSYWADAINSLMLRPPYRAPHPGFNAREEIVVEEDELPAPKPTVTPKEEKHTRYRYTIDLDELEYATLMRLVMKYGSGTGHGNMSTSVDLRIALSEAKIRSIN